MIFIPKFLKLRKGSAIYKEIFKQSLVTVYSTDTFPLSNTAVPSQSQLYLQREKTAQVIYNFEKLFVYN